jgi:hypothetical protein
VHGTLQYDGYEVIAMMHRTLRVSCLALSLACLALALAACATHPAAPATAGNSMPAAVPAWQPPAAAATAQATAAASKQQTPLGCVNSTGTRLAVAPGDCAGFGAVHSKTDIDRTGQPYLGPALQMIDPAVRATGQ